MYGKKDKRDIIRSLELALDEQRRDFDYLDRLYERAKIKNITFLAAAFALLAYVYTGNNPLSLRTRLFIPEQVYGIVLYIIGLSLFLTAIIMLLSALRPQLISTAYDNNQESILLQDYEQYLQYMSRRYLLASKINGQAYARLQNLLNLSFMPLVGGGILLLLLKTFGG